MKKIYTLFLLSASFAFAGEETAQAAQNQGNRSGVAQQQEKANCSRLTIDERHFAMQLSPTNKLLFCNRFTSDQRAVAMQMVGEEAEDGSIMTEDDTVMKVAQDNKMVIPAPSTAPAQPSPRKSCPAK